MPPKGWRKKDTPKWAYVSARLSKAQKAYLLKASTAKGLTLSRFLTESALAAAEKLIGPPSSEVDSKVFSRGPAGWEGQGRRFALSISARLASKLDPASAKDKHAWLREELSSGDRFKVWIWLENCFPEEAKRIPEKKQIQYLKGLMEALKRP